MKKHTLRAFSLCAALVVLAGCEQKTETSVPEETTSPIYVQEDVMQDGNNPSDTKSEDEPTESKTPSTPENANSSFELDEAYNTNLVPNAPNDISVEIAYILTDDYLEETPQLIQKENIPFSSETTYMDVCNLELFSFVSSDKTLTYSLDKNGERFEYYGLAHYSANAPTERVDEIGMTLKIEPTLYLELVDASNEIVRNRSNLLSTDDSVRVKAITALSNSTNVKTEDLRRNSAEMLSFLISTSDGNSKEYQVGMWWDSVSDSLREQGILTGVNGNYFINSNKMLVIKNSNYTIVFVKGGDYLDSISVIIN